MSDRWRSVVRATIGLDLSIAQLGLARDLASGAPPVQADLYWSHYDAATNLDLVRDSDLEIVSDHLVADPMGHSGHLFVLARCPSA